MQTESSTQKPVPLSHFLRVPLSTTVPLSHPGIPASLDWTLGRQKEGTLCAGWLAGQMLPALWSLESGHYQSFAVDGHVGS